MQKLPQEQLPGTRARRRGSSDIATATNTAAATAAATNTDNEDLPDLPLGSGPPASYSQRRRHSQRRRSSGYDLAFARSSLYTVSSALELVPQADRLNFLCMIPNALKPLEARFLHLALHDVIAASAASLADSEALANDASRISRLVADRGLLSALHTVADLIPLIAADNTAAGKAAVAVLLQCTFHATPRAPEGSHGFCTLCQAAFTMATRHPAISEAQRSKLTSVVVELLSGRQPDIDSIESRSENTGERGTPTGHTETSPGTTTSPRPTSTSTKAGDARAEATTAPTTSSAASAAASAASRVSDSRPSPSKDHSCSPRSGAASSSTSPQPPPLPPPSPPVSSPSPLSSPPGTATTARPPSSRSRRGSRPPSQQSVRSDRAVAAGSGHGDAADIDHREVVAATIVDIEKDPRRKAYCFVVEVRWRSGQVTVCRRTHDEFFAFHVALMDKFPEESNKQHRIIPLLPGVFCLFVLVCLLGLHVMVGLFAWLVWSARFGLLFGWFVWFIRLLNPTPQTHDRRPCHSGKRLLSQAFRRRSTRDIAQSRKEGIQNYLNELIS